MRKLFYESQLRDRVYNSTDCISKQQALASKFGDWLASWPNIAQVDCTEHDYEREVKGIDFEATLTDGSILRYQLKCDFQAHKWRNVLFETVRRAYLNKDGLLGAEFRMSTVHYICYLIVESEILHVVDFKSYYTHVVNNCREWKSVPIYNQVKETGEQYITVCWKIPLSVVEKFSVKRVNFGTREVR